MIAIKDLPHNQPTRLHNARCAYCNAEFTGDEPEKEHVIGRLFVPKGSHQQQWNLHLNSCHACNQSKSNLENDVSAISMLQPFASVDEFDAELGEEAERKSKAISLRTGKPVRNSTEELKITQSFAGGTMTFGFLAPPQADDVRLFQLARYQLAGFFFLMTYKKEERMGRYWPGSYMPVGAVRRQDWGNSQKASFSSATADWSFCFGGGPTANGYYQALIKRHPSGPLWSWALEWNKMVRLYGLFGDEDLGKCVFSGFNQPKMAELISDGDATYRMRRETKRIGLDDDLFFSFRNPAC